MAIEIFSDQATNLAENLLSSIPFAGLAINILKKLLGFGSKVDTAKQKQEEEAKRM